MLIALIVSLCVAVMILSVALPLNIYRNERASMLADEYTADLEIGLKADSDHRLVFTDEVEAVIGDRGQVIGEFALTGFFTQAGGEKRQVSIGAFDLEEADEFYSLRYVQLGKITNNNLKNAAIVAESFAKECGLSVGDTFSVNVLGEQYSYTIVGIAEDLGIMKRESVLVDVSSIRASLNERSSLIALLPADFSPFTEAHVKLIDGVDPLAVKAELESLESFADKRIEAPSDSAKTNYMTTLLTVTIVIPALLLIIVAVMMTVSTFDLLAKKRADDLALFKAVGADRAQLGRILYLESLLYALVGGMFGAAISVPLMRWVNGLYSFKYSRLSFGFDDAVIGIGSALLFTALCTYLHLRRQDKKSLAESLSTSNLYTDSHFREKLLIFGSALIAFAILTAILPVRVRFVGAFLWLFATVTFIYVVTPHLISIVSTAISHLLSKMRRGSAHLLLASKSCSASYPLCHAGRIMTVLVTVFMSLSFILGAVESQLTSYFELPSFDYVGVMADDRTQQRVREIDGVVAVAEASMAANITFESGKAATGISARGDVEACFEGGIMPDNMPTGNSVVLSQGLVRMLGIDIGDKVKIFVSGVPCELILTDTVDTVGDFVFYDASYVGSGYGMLCIRTDGSEATYEKLVALFDERGIECLTTDEYFSVARMRVDPQVVMFRVMFIMTLILTLTGVLNVLADQRIARRRELEIMKQSGMRRRGLILLQTTEIICLGLFACILGAVFSHMLCYIVDTAATSFGMTIYGKM